MPIEIIAGAAAVAAGLGAWMKWAVKPVLIAYYVGKRVERIRARQAVNPEPAPRVR